MERATHVILFLISYLFLSAKATQNGGRNATTVPVGVILDLGTLVGKMGMTSISMAIDDFYASHSNFTTRLALHTKDANSDVVQAAIAAVELLGQAGVKAIIGPQKSAQATFLSDLADKAQVPLLSFSATSPTLSPSHGYFVRTTLNDSSQSPAIAALVKAFRWKEVVPIYEDSDYGRDIIPYLVDAFQETNTHIPYRSVIPMHTTDDQIMEELYKLKTMQTRVFIVQMSSPIGSRLFLKANEAGMMSEGYVWIMTDGLGNVVDSLGTTIIESMQGALGLRIQVSRDVDGFAIRWQKRFQEENPNDPLVLLSAFGRWAYDSVWALALAVEEVQYKNPGGLLLQQKVTATNSTDMDRLIGVSAIGPVLLDAILETRFAGVSGDFRIVDNQLLFSSYQIFNVNGRGGRGVGFWTSEHGISTHVRMSSSSILSPVLNPVIWPGESTVVPKGWEIPTSGKKLRIGVPIKDGFQEFVQVKVDPATNATMVTGYSIDVFEAVLQELPYWIPHEYVPFENSTGRRTATYNDLIYQVADQKYDAVVADTTIRASRTLSVDFTLPYTESGIGMIVPVKDSINKNAWIFLKPLTTDLWLGSMTFFFFTGFCVWVMEHRINKDFRGPISQQLGTIFYFSFSTLVFAHRERVENILSRIVVIVWVFVVLILTSSYTASLTSMLTVQQLRPTVSEVQELLKNGEYVGYHKGSFVLDLLKELNFDESKIKVYDTPEEYVEALSKGSSNGGVAAIVHEIPYIKLFLAQHCTGYTMIGPIYKTAGFGFVFPKGSPLVSDISQGILKVTEGDVIHQIEKKWFKDPNSCLNQGTILTSSNLSFRSFWGLFLITGSTSTCALLIFLSFFTYENWDNLKSIDPNKPVSRRVIGWLKYYNTKDLKFRTFRKDKTIYPMDDIVMDSKTDIDLEACNNEQHFSRELSGPYSCVRDGEIFSPTDASITGEDHSITIVVAI